MFVVAQNFVANHTSLHIWVLLDSYLILFAWINVNNWLLVEQWVMQRSALQTPPIFYGLLPVQCHVVFKAWLRTYCQPLLWRWLTYFNQLNPTATGDLAISLRIRLMSVMSRLLDPIDMQSQLKPRCGGGQRRFRYRACCVKAKQLLIRWPTVRIDME